jgi:hypothetical protein
MKKTTAGRQKLGFSRYRKRGTDNVSRTGKEDEELRAARKADSIPCERCGVEQNRRRRNKQLRGQQNASVDLSLAGGSVRSIDLYSRKMNTEAKGCSGEASRESTTARP